MCVCVCVCVCVSVKILVNDYVALSWVYSPVTRILGRLFANNLGDRGSIPGLVIPMTQKMLLDAPLLNTQHYYVQIKGKE